MYADYFLPHGGHVPLNMSSHRPQPSFHQQFEYGYHRISCGLDMSRPFLVRLDYVLLLLYSKHFRSDVTIRCGGATWLGRVSFNLYPYHHNDMCREICLWVTGLHSRSPWRHRTSFNYCRLILQHTTFHDLSRHLARYLRTNWQLHRCKQRASSQAILPSYCQSHYASRHYVEPSHFDRATDNSLLDKLREGPRKGQRPLYYCRSHEALW